MNRLLRTTGAIAALLLLIPAANAEWSDNFDSYALGSGLHGQGGWEGWEGNPAADAYVSDAFAMSTPHSVEITPTSDIVQPFAEAGGQWVLSGYNYIPSGSTGEQYFIVLNTYGVGVHNWSLQILFDSDAGTVTVAEGTGATAIVNDMWVEVRVEIDLDMNTQDIYYNGMLLDSIPWTSTGAMAIGALDLFSNGGSSIYWDDVSLVGEVTPTNEATWGQIKATFR